jgi:hypothetical protein
VDNRGCSPRRWRRHGGPQLGPAPPNDPAQQPRGLENLQPWNQLMPPRSTAADGFLSWPRRRRAEPVASRLRSPASRSSAWIFQPMLELGNHEARFFCLSRPVAREVRDTRLPSTPRILLRRRPARQEALADERTIPVRPGEAGSATRGVRMRADLARKCKRTSVQPAPRSSF